ncbi:MAG: hypothetical protein OHK93_005905 [Ramalina farinacea]|uniref:Uncharacterized protein n=1 Tax=Ramalina farinacea TaxID=258253 RepID=A0AA43QXW3_9LECA|nr:hypothetical protein [Ramalina farinacea]
MKHDGTLEEADKLQTLWLRKEDIQYYEVFDSVCAVAPHIKICIGSSPQEAVPFATMCVLGPEDMDAELLGKPVANTRVSAPALIRRQDAGNKI